MPSIQDGQKVAAKVPCLKPPDHSGDQVDALAEMSTIEVAVSQAFFTAGLVSAMMLSLLVVEQITVALEHAHRWRRR